jgi:serine phosphatase RsbU (regulator of sigma subunit)
MLISKGLSFRLDQTDNPFGFSGFVPKKSWFSAILIDLVRVWLPHLTKMRPFTLHKKGKRQFFLCFLRSFLFAVLASGAAHAQDDLGSIREKYILALNSDNFEARATYASQLAEKYREVEKYDEAAKYLNEAIAVYEKINQSIGLLRSYRTLGELQVRTKQYQKAILSYREVIKQYRLLGNHEGVLYTTLVVADLYNKVNSPQNAISGLRQRAEPLSIRLGLDSARLKTYNLIVVSYLLAKQGDKAEEYQQKSNLLADSMKQKLVSGITARAEETNQKQAQELKQADYLLASKERALRSISEEKREVEKKIEVKADSVSLLTLQKAESDQQVVAKEESLDAQRKITFAISGFLLLVSGLTFLLFRALSANRRYVAKLGQQNAEIATQKSAIESQKNELELRNRQITDSIRYAERIQQSLMPSDAGIAGFFSDFFVLNRPKDIVSGDFYWFANLGDHALIALADCTGHGVPGAFMSIIGHNLLYEIVHQRRVHQPGQILSLLNEGVRTVLQQQNGFNDDGMDIAICLVSQPANGGTERLVRFAGAKSSIHLVQGRLLSTIKGTNRSIGGRQKKPRPYEEHEFVLTRGNMIYFNTDGVHDQRNEANEKFGSPRFHETLKKLAGMPPSAQNELLADQLAHYQGRAPQVDDITIVGIRL